MSASRLWDRGRERVPRIEAGAERAPPRGALALRTWLSVACSILGSVVALAGGLALYGRTQIVDQNAFADRAVEAIHQPVVQRVVSREITVQLLEPALPDAIAARPVIQSAVRAVITSKPFIPVIRLAARHGQRLLFERSGGNAVFDVADAGTVISSALRALSPRLAQSIPRGADAVLLTLRRRGFAEQTLRAADHVRLLGILLPVAAALLLALSVVAAPNRRRALTRTATAVGVTGVVFLICFELLRRYAQSHVYGLNELSDADVRRALGDLWDSYLSDLAIWVLVATGLAWLIAAASASIFTPYSAATGLRRLRELAGRPVSIPVRTARGVIVLAIGIFAILKPTLAFRIVAVLAGCLLIYLGASEVLSATAGERRRMRPLRDRRPRRLAAFGAFGTAVVAAFVVAFMLTGSAGKVQASPVPTCNGYAQLCGRRLNEVAFAGTHNSMSAADSPGWLIANQDRAIAQQLQDGIRLFKISTHYGIDDSSGQVLTDIAAAGPRLNRISEQLPPAARQALQRLSRSLTPGSLKGRKRDIWLCHTACELGATRMTDFLGTIKRFLSKNPDQVFVFFDEDYVAERDLQNAFKRAGLFGSLATLTPNQPLPTLGQMIRSHRNIVVFAQTPTDPRYRWDMYGFNNWIQDTPLGATKPSQFSCKPYRGGPTNPLLMMNNWADIFPPRPTPNIPLVKRPFILSRARQCVAQRGLVPNLILTDYYNRGDVVGAVAQLNGVAGTKPAPLVPWL